MRFKVPQDRFLPRFAQAIPPPRITTLP